MTEEKSLAERRGVEYGRIEGMAVWRLPIDPDEFDSPADLPDKIPERALDSMPAETEEKIRNRRNGVDSKPSN